MASRVVLHGEYDVWRRDELRAQLAQLDLTDDVTIDMRDVSLIGAGAAALLIKLQRELRSRKPGARVTLAGAPHIVRRVIELCGAADLFVFSSDG